MTPQEKAKELDEKFSKELRYITDGDKDYAKQCALIAVEEIITESKLLSGISETHRLPYWQQVKAEIEKL